MTAPTPRTWATIDLNALNYNFARVRELCPSANITPVIKSNGYGHGVAKIAKSLAASNTQFDCFIVATLQEALEVAGLGLGKSVVLLAGFIDESELRLCLDKKIQPVIHSAYQVEIAMALLVSEYQQCPKKFWVEFNSGMNRLGQRQEASIATYKKLAELANTDLVFMSHLAFADDMLLPASHDFTQQQISRFAEAKNILHRDFVKLETSFAASAGILSLPETHHDTVRPGVMLYGSSPLTSENGLDVGLRPVMTLSSRLIAINEVKAGETLGYGASYTCRTDTRIGVVSVGYGDGYPRSASSETPVVVKTATGDFKSHVAGRVSMDMITIDLGGSDAKINDEVVLWGKGLCADEVAKSVDTIAYELFCKVTDRVNYRYLD
ncbi:MAG TPA: alanine racemase [Gammaproteobacteria bacterium]|nr:alanine racemase [Gammaproteobacteria bacterium]